MAIKVVTDSTSDLPRELAEELDIAIVPLYVLFGTETYRDNIDINADEFYDRLTTEGAFPKTSQPSPGEFVQVYDEIGKDADGILSIHVSARESGTYNAAMQATGETSAECPIEVVDSTQFSMALGMVVITAARAAKEGATLDEDREITTGAIKRARCIAMFDTLEYLEKGGRIGKARAMLGSVLKIKPMITIRDGQVHELAKARTTSKAVTKLKQVARGFAPVESLCVLYSTTPELAQEVADDLRDMLPDGAKPFMSRFGPVVGAYAGPGAVGIGILLAEESGEGAGG